MNTDQSQLRIVLAGSVGSSRRTLLGLLRHKANIVGVLGLSMEKSSEVSAFARLDDLAQEENIPYAEFFNINSPDTLEKVRAWAPDLLFVVGLSQLVKPELLSIPSRGCIGFHPTWLPEGRGRAPIAWLTLDGCPGAATFFLMDEGTDSGPIMAQAPFYVSDRDYAADVIKKMESAIDAALDTWIPQLRTGLWHPMPQHHNVATYNGRRAPDDGLIDWGCSADQICSLIRATSRPHPGAYSYLNNQKLIIWRAEIENQKTFRGVVGRTLYVDADKGVLMQTGNGLLWLTEVEFIFDSMHQKTPQIRVGMKLGYSPQDEIYLLKRQISDLEARLTHIERTSSR